MSNQVRFIPFERLCGSFMKASIGVAFVFVGFFFAALSYSQVTNIQIQRGFQQALDSSFDQPIRKAPNVELFDGREVGAPTIQG